MSNNYNPFDLLPPKDVIQNAIKQMKTNAMQLLEDIRILRQNPLADWLVEEKQKSHQQLMHKIHRYEMYLNGVDISKDWEAAKMRAKERPIQDFYTGGRKSGNRIIGKCPLHNETTGSFIIYLNQNTWWCFGNCQTGGDVISYIQKTQNCDFKEAIKILNG